MMRGDPLNKTIRISKELPRMAFNYQDAAQTTNQR